MNYIQELGDKEFSEIRIIEQDGEPWFIGKDICNYFDDSNHIRTLKRVDDIDKQIVELIDSMGRKQSAIAVNESGMYTMLFTMQPQKAHKDGMSDEYPIEIRNRIEKVRRFKHWVTSEVLPSIRKTGGYQLPQTYAEALRALADKAEETERLEKQNAVLITDNERMKPKEVFVDAVATSDDTILIGQLAKILKGNGIEIGQNRLFKWLRKNGFLIKKGEGYNLPSQYAMERELFKIKERTVNNPDGSVRITKTVMVTGKGQQYFVNRFLNGEDKGYCGHT